MIKVATFIRNFVTMKKYMSFTVSVLTVNAFKMLVFVLETLRFRTLLFLYFKLDTVVQK